MSTSSVHPAFGYFPVDAGQQPENGTKLCVEVGEEHIGLLLSDPEGSKVKYFACYVVSPEEMSEKLRLLLQENSHLKGPFTDVIMINNRHQMVLVPELYHKDHLSETLLQTIHGDLKTLSVHNDPLHQWEINVVHGMEEHLEDMLRDEYPQLRTVHFTTVALRHAFRNMHWEQNQLVKLYFHHQTFFMMVFHGDQLQIAQQFHYQTTEDAIYHILNVADKYRLDVTEVWVQVSGLIDASSSLWQELRKHFLEISLEEISLNGDEQLTVPQHYFTPFLMATTCV